MTKYVTLDDAVARAKASPDTFEVPSEADIANIKVGDYVKLIFLYEGDVCEGERMWVQVKVLNKDAEYFGGLLSNDPVVVPLKLNDYIEFDSKNIISIFPV